MYGHNAIRIQNNIDGTDWVYHYGTFDFNTPGFALKFMRGKLPYMMTVSDYASFLREYQYFKRSVTSQELNLNILQCKSLIKFLEFNLRPENREYKYDFFMDNCATRIRDVLSNKIEGINWDEALASKKTFRQIIKEYQVKKPWTDFGIDLIIGARADRKTSLKEETFIPDYLANALQKVSYSPASNNKLIRKETPILEFLNQKSGTGLMTLFLSPIFLFSLLLFFEINLLFKSLIRKPWKWTKLYDKVWMIVVFIVSILMMFMWFGTDHIPTKDNWNLLWANPLIPIGYFIKNISPELKRWLKYIITLCLTISIVNAIPGVQILPQFFHIVVSIISMILLIKLWRNDIPNQNSLHA
jgi:hypothetical protein